MDATNLRISPSGVNNTPRVRPEKGGLTPFSLRVAYGADPVSQAASATMDVRRRILFDLLTAPTTLLPVAGGLALMVLGWAAGLGTAVQLAGVAGVAAGLGVAAARAVFGLDALARHARERLLRQEERQREKALDKLDRRLVRDGDPRTQNALREARLFRRNLAEDVRAGRFAGGAQEVLARVEDLFRACAGNLERAHELWDEARRMGGTAGDRALAEREALIEEAVRSVAHLGRMTEGLRAAAAPTDQGGLDRMRLELDEAIEVAHRTAQRLAAWETRPRREEDFRRQGP